MVIIQQPTENAFNELEKLQTEIDDMRQEDQILRNQLQQNRGLHTLASRSQGPSEAEQKLGNIMELYTKVSGSSDELRKQMGIVTKQIKQLRDIAKDEEREVLQLKHELNM